MKLPPIFSDKAVFQRNMYFPVWGTAHPEHLLRLTLGNGETFCRASKTGEFLARFSPMDAGGPFDLQITDTESNDTLTLHDIMVGDVWLAGGQSNMEYLLGSDWTIYPSDTPEEFEKQLNTRQLREFENTISNPEMVRFIQVPRQVEGCRESSFDGKWQYVTKDTADQVCACGAWFSRFLREKIDVPVGIIACNYGGTIAEAWTSRGGLLSNPETAPMIHALDRTRSKAEEWVVSAAEKVSVDMEEFCRKYCPADPGNKGFGLGYASPDFQDSDWKDMRIPGSWIGQGIAGNGVVWFRKKVQIPENWVGKELHLCMGGVDKQDITYFNNAEVGRTGSGFQSGFWNALRDYTVPASFVNSRECTIAVRAYSFMYDGSFGGVKSRYYLSNQATGEKISIAGDWKAFPEFDAGKIKAPNAPAGSVFGSDNANAPCNLFDSMLSCVIPFGIKGVLWYQGESNAGSIPEALSYQKKLEIMIRDWRYAWGQGDFPFIQVQLAGYRAVQDYEADSAWARLRESQRLCCLTTPNVFMATAVDIGDEEDIHPLNKKEVGRRLALAALKHVYYQENVTPFGPLFDCMTVEGGKVRVKFHCGEGMFFKDGPAKGFYLAECMDPRREELAFYPADEVRIEGSTVVLSSKRVKAPAAVRYAWADDPDGNLYNAAGLPASPFRTDTESI